jgi:hypothetical protein
MLLGCVGNAYGQWQEFLLVDESGSSAIRVYKSSVDLTTSFSGVLFQGFSIRLCFNMCCFRKTGQNCRNIGSVGQGGQKRIRFLSSSVNKIHVHRRTAK